MTSVFIVRPFGKRAVPVKKNGNDVSVDVDFTAIDRDLIQEALKRNGLVGQTTEVIAEAGNIRLDMFQMLIAYDLVIADISIDNANVFYELGIRHALRPNGTILIRLDTGGRDVRFDLKTDRYIVYDRQAPAASIDRLAKAIKDTMRVMTGGDSRPDSPVFLLLPALTPTDPAKLIVVPSEFQKAIEKAESDKVHGPTMLALLAGEAERCAWAREGVRLVGRAQRRMKSFEAARESWEFIRDAKPGDVEANLQLATIFQRLGDLASASHACRRVLGNQAADRADRADARSQLARNDKTSWVADFRATSEAELRTQAISDERLIEAFEGYMAGFAEDLNNYYSGINALGLLTIIVELGEKEANAWAGRFETSRKAAAALDDYREQLTHLRGAVRMSLDKAKKQVEQTGKPDEWLLPTEAQYALLTPDGSTAFVKNAYRASKNAGRSGFSVQSEAAQVRIFQQLGLFAERCKAALEGLGIPTNPIGVEGPDLPGLGPRPLATGTPLPGLPHCDRVIVGTGHRADAPGRKSPRFPNTDQAIAKAKSWLRQQLEAEKAKTTGTVSGIGGAASGTDLLFHEACEELGIPTTVVLAIPRDDYCRQSVMDGGPDWVEKYHRLLDTRPVITLSDSAELPVWATSVSNYGVFQRANIWMMQNALLQPRADVTLVALWDEKEGDGPGGTADMVKLAQSHGAKVCIKNTNELFGIAQ
jgi:Tetratricopeptide Repeats-Sensor